MNSDTGFPINLGAPVPEGSNIRMDLFVCDPNLTQETTYNAGVQFLPRPATCTGGVCKSVAWQDEAYFTLLDQQQYKVSVTYQPMPREPGTFAFFPRLLSTPGDLPGDNVIVTGQAVELATCKPGQGCTNGLVPHPSQSV
ncbi:MAG: hypothetical protein H0W27_08700 [Actinobacteria bacterium]|nr:hypothetical protein [Actinomycetota bacterium]